MSDSESTCTETDSEYGGVARRKKAPKRRSKKMLYTAIIDFLGKGKGKEYRKFWLVGDDRISDMIAKIETREKKLYKQYKKKKN